MEQHPAIPWYRQFWPWFLIALPALALLAGLITWSVAVEHVDELVNEHVVQRDL